jgi:hypothetical protein
MTSEGLCCYAAGLLDADGCVAVHAKTNAGFSVVFARAVLPFTQNKTEELHLYIQLMSLRAQGGPGTSLADQERRMYLINELASLKHRHWTLETATHGKSKA